VISESRRPAAHLKLLVMVEFYRTATLCSLGLRASTAPAAEHSSALYCFGMHFKIYLFHLNNISCGIMSYRQQKGGFKAIACRRRRSNWKPCLWMISGRFTRGSPGFYRTGSRRKSTNLRSGLRFSMAETIVFLNLALPGRSRTGRRAASTQGCCRNIAIPRPPKPGRGAASGPSGLLPR
jgi:hypothetical protein